MKIASTMPFFPAEDIEWILSRFKEILDGKSFLSQYKYCQEFERAFSNYVGSKYAVTTSNGTCSLEIIFRCLNLKGYDIIVPANTFAATAFAIMHAGGRPVFADCCQDLTINPEDVKRKITDKTKAIVTVHIGGLVSPKTCELIDLCKDKELYLIEDAAHAHGTMLDGKKAGTFGIAGSFSFFSTKVMTTGEGGMITTDDREIYEKALVLRDQAKIRKGIYQNYHEEIGYNWRMTEIQALMGIKQLERLEEFIKRRCEIAKIFDEKFTDMNDLTPLRTPENVRHNYYKYIAFLREGINREDLQKTMKEKYEISMGGYVYEIPLHQQPAFKEYRTEPLPVSEDLCNRHICPPIYYQMKDEEVQYVANSITKYLKALKD